MTSRLAREQEDDKLAISLCMGIIKGEPAPEVMEDHPDGMDQVPVAFRVNLNMVPVDRKAVLCRILCRNGARNMKASNTDSITDLIVRCICMLEVADLGQDPYIKCTCNGIEKQMKILCGRIMDGKRSANQQHLLGVKDVYPDVEASDSEDEGENDDLMGLKDRECGSTIHQIPEDPEKMFSFCSAVLLNELTPLEPESFCKMGAFLFTQIMSRFRFDRDEDDYAAVQRLERRFEDRKTVDVVDVDYKHLHKFITHELAIDPSHTFSHNFRQDFFMACTPTGLLAYACKGNKDEPNPITLLNDEFDADYARFVYECTSRRLNIGIHPTEETTEIKLKEGQVWSGTLNSKDADKDLKTEIAWIGPSLLYTRNELLILHVFTNHVYDVYRVDMMKKYVVQIHQLIGPPNEVENERKEKFGLFKPVKIETGLAGMTCLNKRHLLSRTTREWRPMPPIIVELPSTYKGFHWYVRVCLDDTWHNYGCATTAQAILTWLSILHRHFQCQLEDQTDLIELYTQIVK